MAENKLANLRKEEAVDFVSRFYRTSWDWRSQSYHDNWDTYERNYNNIYDPTIKAKKMPWQATMFDPLSVTNVEVIASALTKLLLGKKRPITLEPRESGDSLQAELETKRLDYEVEKSGFQVASYDCIKEACIFGSGFLKFYYEREKMPRRVKKPVRYGFMGAAAELVKGNPVSPDSISGYKEEVENVLVKDNVKCIKVHIRDIFLEPNSTDLKKCIHRDRYSYGEIKRLADQGYFDKESVAQLEGVSEGDTFEVDLQTIKADLGISDPEIPRPSYDRKITIWEYWGLVPKKWLDLGMAEGDKADELVPGKITVASGKYFLCSEDNPMPDMEPPFVQMDYIRNGSTYGTGVCQLIKGIQEESNEIRNLRVDNVTLSMNKMFIARERKISNPDDVQSVPGRVIWTKGLDEGPLQNVIMELPISDVAISAFRETGELAMKAQEVTAANRVTTGIAGQGKDTNSTLGGMELLRQAAFDRFTVYAYVIGRSFIIKCAKKMMALSYQNSSPEKMRRVLGAQPITFLGPDGQDVTMAKFMTYKMIPPHELELDYDYVPVDIFSMENKAQKRQALASDLQLTGSLIPTFNPKPGLKKLYSYDGFEADEIEEILKGLDGPVSTPMGMGMGVPSLSKTTKQATGEVAPPSSPVPVPGA